MILQNVTEENIAMDSDGLSKQYTTMQIEDNNNISTTNDPIKYSSFGTTTDCIEHTKECDMNAVNSIMHLFSQTLLNINYIDDFENINTILCPKFDSDSITNNISTFCLGTDQCKYKRYEIIGLDIKKF